MFSIVPNVLHKISAGFRSSNLSHANNYIKGTTAQFWHNPRINFMRCYSQLIFKIMDLMLKILITQMAILVCGHFSMHPSSPIADFVEKKFGDYGKALNVINGSQIILIIVTLIVWFWRVA